MPSYNKVIMMGNLTRDPCLSALPSGIPVADFGLASNRKWRSADGQQREEVCFVDCTAFGKTAETITQHLAKGRAIMVEGRLRYETWQANDGQKRSKHKISVENFTFVDSKTEQEPPAATARPQAPAEDDIPF